MSLKSRQLIEEAKLNLSNDYKEQFKGIKNYTRIDLITYNVLDMLTVSESIISYDILKTYLPVLFSGVISREKVLDTLHEDKSDFICDFNEGVIYKKDIDHKPYLDFVTMAKEQGICEEDTTISDKNNLIMTGDLSELYEKRKGFVEQYISESAIKISDDFDIYDRYDVPTSATITRQKMDKSKDIYNT